METKAQKEHNSINHLQAKIKFFEEKVVEAAENEECNRKNLDDAQNEILRNKVQYENSIKELEAKQIVALENKEIEFSNIKNKLDDLKDNLKNKLEDLIDNTNNKLENLNDNSKNKLESVKDNLKEKLDESVEMKNKSEESQNKLGGLGFNLRKLKYLIFI